MTASSSTTSSSASSPLGTGSHNGISGGAIAGIVVGCVFGVAIILAIGFYLLRRRRTRQEHLLDNEESTERTVHESDPSTTISEKDGVPTVSKTRSGANAPIELGGGETAPEMESMSPAPLPAELESPSLLVPDSQQDNANREL